MYTYEMDKNYEQRDSAMIYFQVAVLLCQTFTILR